MRFCYVLIAQRELRRSNMLAAEAVWQAVQATATTTKASTVPSTVSAATTSSSAAPISSSAAAVAPTMLKPAHPKLASYLSQINAVIDTVVRETSLPPDSNGWIFNSRQKDIDIYTKKVGEVNLSKGIGVIPMPALLVHHVFSDLSDRKQWDEMFDDGIVIEVIDETLGIACTQFKLKAPMFVSARDLIVSGRTLYKPDGAVWIVSCSVEHDRAPKPGSGGFVRAELKFGGTIIEPLDENSCRVTYTLASDPKGSLPAWVVAIAAVAQPLCIAVVRDHMAKNKAKLMALLPERQARREKVLAAEREASAGPVGGDVTDATAATSATTSATAAAAAAKDGFRDGQPIRYYAEVSKVLETVRAAVASGRNEDGWSFHSRMRDVDISIKTSGTVNISKGEGVVPAPAAVVAHVFTDMKGRSGWDELFDFGRDLEVLDEELKLVCSHMAFKAPWPVTPRDLVVAGRTIVQDDGSIWLISCSVDHPAMPVSSNGSFIRAHLEFGGTVIFPIDEQSCRVVYVVASDPKGTIPKWLVNAMNEKSPLCLAVIRDYIKSHPQVQQEVQQRLARAAVMAAGGTGALLLPSGPERRCGHVLGLQLASAWETAVFATKFQRVAAFAKAWPLGRTLSAVTFACRSLWSMRHKTAPIATSNADRPVIGLIALQVMEACRELPPSAEKSPWWSETANLFVRVALDDDTMQTNLTSIVADVPRKLRRATFAVDASCFTLRVLNPTARVRLSLFASLTGGARPMERLIGEAFLPIADLSDQQSRDGWLPLLVPVASDGVDDAASEPSHVRPMVRVGVKMAMAEAVDWLVTVATPPEGSESTADSESVVLPEYSPEKLVAHCFQLADVARPVMVVVEQGFSIMNWDEPSLSVVATFLLLLCCWWPGLVPVLLGLFVIAFIALEYVQKKFIRVMRGTHRWARLEAQQRQQIGAVVELLQAQEPLRSPETRRLLRYVQYQAGVGAAAIEDALSLCDWTHPTATKMLLLFTCVCMCLSLIFPTSLTLLTLTLTVCCWHTTPLTLLRHVCASTYVYWERRKERRKLK